MPRLNRRSKRRASADDDWETMHLTRGHVWFPGTGFEDDEMAMRAAWESRGEQLTAEWIRERPGSRPFGWWKFNAPERRRRIDGVIHPFDDKLRQDHVERMSLENPKYRDRAYRLFFGLPSCLIGGFPSDFEARYEGELAYLDRLGLLTAEERRELFGEDSIR